MCTGKHLVDPAISKTHIDQSIKELLKKVTINREFWIPYLAGYSKDDWKDNPIVYMDCRLPKELVTTWYKIDITRYLLIHECVEKCLMDELGMPYILAHNLATAAEKTAVEADGHSWTVYTNSLTPYIREAEKQPEGKESPKALDKRPYEQEKAPILAKMA